MTPPEGHLARLEHAREDIAKRWLVRLIEHSSLDEIEGLPTERIARELPDLILDVVRSAAGEADDPLVESSDRLTGARRFADLAGGGEPSPARIARDAASLQALLLRKLCEGGMDSDPEGFADAAERLALAVGSIQTAAVEEVTTKRSRELESQANTDTLTGLYNLRYLQRVMTQLVGYHQRYEHPFAMLLLDVDGLKRINDAHGHAAGDRVLVQVAMAVRRSVRTVDTPARMGGDEFIVLAPHQSAESAGVLAERLATAVEREAAPPEGPTIGVSIGVVACPEHGTEAESLMELADQAMYRAKASGESVALAEAAAENGSPSPRPSSSSRR